MRLRRAAATRRRGRERRAEDPDPDRATVVVHVPFEWFDQSGGHDLDDVIAAALDSGVPRGSGVFSH